MNLLTCTILTFTYIKVNTKREMFNIIPLIVISIFTIFIHFFLIGDFFT